MTAAGSDVFAVEWHGAILRYSAFELSLPESLQEGETVSATGTISLRSTPEHDLNIALITDMPSAVTIPAAVVISAGQTSVSFPLTARDNASSDATRTLLVTASANGCNAGNRFIRIYDDETAELITEMPSAVAEDDGLISGGGTVRISASLPTDLTISLTSDAPHVIRVPQSVTVPAGEDRAAFDVMVTDDAEIDGPETVQITASVRGWTSGSASVTVTDNDQYRLNLILPETADEGDGVLPGAGQVEVPVPFDGDITVALFSDDLSEMRVPEAVTIPAGQTVAAFDLTPIRDALIDGSQTAVLSASASGFPGTRASVEITDADGRWDDVTRGTNKLRDIWGSSPDNVYAVGSDGLIFHYDGTAWQPEQNITTAPLRGIWGSGPSDIFAAGNDGTILRYDGRQWQKMPTHTDETFYAVWGSSAKNVFAVGGKSNTGGIILQYDGSEWREMVTGLRGPLNTIWGNSENDIFAAGDKGQILHYDGTEWRETDSGTDDTIKSLWGSSGSDVFAVGSGLVLHYNGTEWQPMDGAAGQNLRAIWGDSSDNVFAVGGSGLILHYDGTEWREMECPTDEPLWAVWGSSGKNVFVAGGDCAIAGFDGKTWTMSKDSDNYYRGVWGCPAETGPGYTAFMVGDDGLIVQYDGSDLTVMEKGFYPDLNSIWGRSATDIYAVGDDGLILRFDGVRWHRMDSGGFFESLRGVWGLPSEQGEDVFAVGDDGRILRFDGVEWHRMESGTDTDLTGIRGTSGSDIFVVGKKCIILHYDGAEWKQMETDTGRNLNAVWGSSGDSVWAAGDSGLLHYDGIRWRQPDSPLSNPLYGLWGRCASDLFAVGSSVILHYDGEEWTEMDGPSTPLDGVWGEDNGEIIVVGRYNTIVRFSPVGIEIPETVAEGDGLLEGQGRVYIRQSSDTDLAVTLTSHDTTEITVPTEITIPAGETDAIFDLTVREDDLWDGTQRVMVTASAPGSHLGTGFIRIRDNESAPLSVQLPGQASESDGVLAEAGSVTLSQTAGKAVTVSLASDDPKVSVPENITVPAGQTGALFDLTILDETVFDGDRFVTVTASVDGWIPGSAVIEVSDNEVAELSLETAEAASEDITGTKSSLSGVTSVSENDGEVPVILSVPGILADDLEVALSSDQPDLISPDATVILPAGAQSVRFPLSITDNAETDGSRIVTVSAAAPGWISATIDIEITDDDPGTLRFGSARYMVREEAGSAEIGVVRELSDSGRIEISYASSDGTAFADTDYRPVSGTLVFEDGETRKIISVPLMADAETEGGERFYLSLENPLGGAVRGTPDTAEIIIADDMTWVSYAGDVTKHHLRGLWGGSDTDVFAVGWQGTILHWNGKGWEDMSLESGTAVAFEGIWGSSGKNVFAVGQDGTIFHYDGSSWTPLERKTERPLYAVWGDSGADIFVGGSGVLLHCDGKKWQKTDVGTADIRGIWGDSATDIFAVGCDGAILHYDGTEWLPMESGTADHLYSVWGDSGTDVFAAGAYGTIVHYNGTEWTPMAGPDQFVLYLDAVWGASGSDVLAAGWGGTVLRYDGTDWKALHRETGAGLHALWGPSGTGAALDVFAVGENGEVRHYTPSSE
ncbi:hypothetical protein DENIS_3067 [Desulfonema ishimotonii]|uniref:Calx-beta domain-containing protein n=1 Tax=Desulfonema ishimotonii TaxID=45657 RepID=A0A401FYR6_9BACT|nr:Calx-beta domain-containing protein [Desulfonema ishimotonii]GBC62104.1 hypothetical protein DENIS_3067 [Desulfonema ishimotonii]